MTPRKQNFRVFFTLPDGGKGSVVVSGQPGHAEAATLTTEILRGSSLVKEGEEFRITRVRPLPGRITRAQALAEAAVVAVGAIGIPLAGLWHLASIFGK